MARHRRSASVSRTRPSVQHVVTRCTRQLHLLEDNAEAASAPHEADRLSPRAVLSEQIQRLCDVSAVGVLGFAFMGNHVHLLVEVDPPEADGWSAREVVDRWASLHPVVLGRSVEESDREARAAELVADAHWVAATRAKLCSLSQFMKELKQHVAQVMNRHRKVSGAFWQGRFKNKQAKDAPAVMTMSGYIDLNPFKAGRTASINAAEHTSQEVREAAARGRSSADPSSGSAETRSRRAGGWLRSLFGGVERVGDATGLATGRRGPLLPGVTLAMYRAYLHRVARVIERRREQWRAAGKRAGALMEAAVQEVAEQVVGVPRPDLISRAG